MGNVIAVLCNINQLPDVVKGLTSIQYPNPVDLPEIRPYKPIAIEAKELPEQKGGIVCHTCGQYFDETDSIVIIRVIETTGVDYNVYCHPSCLPETEWHKSVYKDVKVLKTVRLRQLKAILDGAVDKSDFKETAKKRTRAKNEYDQVLSLFKKGEILSVEQIRNGQSRYVGHNLSKVLYILKKQGLLVSKGQGVYALADGVENENGD